MIGLALFYDFLFTIPPVLTHLGLNADLLYRFFQPLCHQIDERSFHIFGNKLAVCSRCASIYYGATFGMICYPLFKPLKGSHLPGLLFLAVPLGILIADFAMNFTEVGHNTFVSRSLTGGLFGISLAFYIVPAWMSLMKELKFEGSPQHEK